MHELTSLSGKGSVQDMESDWARLLWGTLILWPILASLWVFGFRVYAIAIPMTLMTGMLALEALLTILDFFRNYSVMADMACISSTCRVS
jgi:hypothetical protein